MKVKKLSKAQIIIAIVLIVVLIIAIPTVIYCTKNKETPVQMVQTIFNDNKKLIGKWQDDSGLLGYEFKEEGVYDSYISNFNFTGKYTAANKKLTLKNTKTNGTVVYAYEVKGDELTLTLLETNGQAPTNQEEVHTFKKVDEFNFKTITDAIQELADQFGISSEDDTEEENAEATSDAEDEDTSEEATEEETEEATEEETEEATEEDED